MRYDEFDHHAPDFIEDPAATSRELLAKCPVLHSSNYGGFWLLSRYRDVCRAAMEYRDFTSAVPGMTVLPPLHARDYPHIPLELDPPEHTQYRRLVSGIFERRRVEEMRGELHTLAASLVEPIARSGGGELVAEFCVPMSVGTLARLMGLPAEDAPRWAEWVRRMGEGSLGDPAGQQRAVAEYEEYLDNLIRERRDAPGEDFISLLIAETVDGQRLSDAEIRGFGVAMLLAGHETTQGGMSQSLHYLALNPEVRGQIWADPELIPSAVNELLRLHAPIQIFLRNAARDVVVDGHEIPAGDVVALNFGAANRDPEAFPEPDRCILDRKPNRHVTFGFGHHLCLGIHVARMEMQIMLAEFRDRMPDYRLDPDRPPQWKSRGDVRGLRSLHVIA